MSNAGRKLKRAMVERALHSQVAGAIPEQVPQPPAEAGTPPGKTKRIKLPITEEQMNLLLNAQAEVNQANGNLSVLLKTCLAQHHITEGRIAGVHPGRPAKIEVEVSDEPTKRKKGG